MVVATIPFDVGKVLMACLCSCQVGESVEMHCEAQEAEGTQRPSVVWRRRDGLPLQKSRVRALGGNITIDTLRRQDFGIYQCVASNEVSHLIRQPVLRTGKAGYTNILTSRNDQMCFNKIIASFIHFEKHISQNALYARILNIIR